MDDWDSPRQQMSGMVRQAGGTVVPVAAEFALVPLQIKRLRDHFQRTLHAVGSSVTGPSDPVPAIGLAIPAHSSGRRFSGAVLLGNVEEVYDLMECLLE